MKFEWDERKNEINIDKHGLDFSDGEELFLGHSPLLAVPDTAQEYGEERWKGIGMIDGRIVVAIFVLRTPETIRFISLRKANRKERSGYEKALQDQLGQG
jgi:uncharacterized DUF497 family protein